MPKENGIMKWDSEELFTRGALLKILHDIIQLNNTLETIIESYLGNFPPKQTTTPIPFCDGSINREAK